MDDTSEASTPHDRKSKKDKGKAPARQTNTAPIDNLMDVMEAMMDRLGSIETMISAQGNGDQASVNSFFINYLPFP